jgi:hypothetical protein
MPNGAQKIQQFQGGNVLLGVKLRWTRRKVPGYRSYIYP